VSCRRDSSQVREQASEAVERGFGCGGEGVAGVDGEGWERAWAARGDWSGWREEARVRASGLMEVRPNELEGRKADRVECVSCT